MKKDIQKMLDLRRPGQSLVSTQRKEGDIVEILSGVFRGYTTGAPITTIIWNKDHDSKSYAKLKTTMRPGHSDYPAFVKYKKFNDLSWWWKIFWKIDSHTCNGWCNC